MMDIFGNLPELPPRDEKISRTWGGGTAVLYNGAVKPGVIPATTQTRYISCLTALNIRQLWEDTGDWHQHTALFVPASKPDVELPCVGTGEDIDTTPSLGSTGVRDMKRALDRLYKREIAEPIWVANHFRAIADIVMMDQITLMNLHRMRPNVPTFTLPRQATVREINRWLNTEKQIERLVDEYLTPLRNQMDGACRAIYDEWLPTVIWE